MVEKEDESEWSTEVVIFFSVQGSAIIVLNVFSIIVFWRKRTTLKRTSYFLVNLAVADTLVGVVEVFYSYLRGSFLDGSVALSTSSSLCSLAVISLERLLATWKPLRHRASPTKHYFIAISLLWTLSVAVGVLYMLYATLLVESVIISCILAACTALILCTILSSYIAIWYVVVFHPRPVHHNREQNKKLTKTLFIVTALSLLTWAPTIVRIVTVVDPKMSWRVHVDVTINTLMFANSLVNPIVYIFRMQEFREELKRLLCRSCPSNQE